MQVKMKFNRSRKRKNRWLWMFALCLAAASLVLILLSVIRNYRKPQVVGEYIEREQASVLLNELDLGDLLEGANKDGTGENKSQDAYLTYGEYLQVLDAIYEKKPDVYDKESYEYDRKQALSSEYAKKHFLLKEDFFKVYYTLAKKLVPGKEISEHIFYVIGGDGNIFDLDGEPATRGTVLVADGSAASMEEADFQEVEFPDYGGYLYQKVTAVVSLERVILILHADDSAIKLKRAFISSNTEEGLYIWYRDWMLRLSYQPEVYPSFERVADVMLEKGNVKEVIEYQDMVSGKILRIADDVIELEGEGTYPLAEDLKVYKLYGEKEHYSLSDVKIGYAFTDFVLDGDRIIAALVVREENMQNIRVLIKSQNFASDFHEKVTLQPNCAYVVSAGGEQTEHEAGESLTFERGDAALEAGRVKITPKTLTGSTAITSLNRTQGTPSYHGTLELVLSNDGIAVINEVLLEEYLYSVVPSEMPASYPMEALKAQAVSARTFAYKNMQKSGLPSLGAHVDDSTTYQVYNNILQDERTTLAVRETQGKVLMTGSGLADTYYYSTSCGYSTDLSVWGRNDGNGKTHLKARHLAEGSDLQTETKDAEEMQQEENFRRMITAVNESDFEKDKEFYRWTYDTGLREDILKERLVERQKARGDQILIRQADGSFSEGKIGAFGKITGLEVTKRSPGGAACELTITGTKQTIRVLSEYNIRYILVNESKEIVLQSGRTMELSSLLLSAFIIVDAKGEDAVEGYKITGGGYGHGIGMSQNGAGAMGEAGYSYDSILEFFFSGVTIAGIDGSS